MKISGTIAILMMLAIAAFGQRTVLDKVVCKIGNEYVLLSEIEERYALASEKGITNMQS